MYVFINAYAYSPDMLVIEFREDCTVYIPGVETRLFTVSSPLGRIQDHFLQL